MQIENACFPPTERCTPAMMKARLQQFPEWCLTARRGGSIVGFIHGMSIGQPAVQDAFYYIPALHRPGAPWQCVLGLAVAPAFRGKGAAHSLMKAYAAKARKACKQGIVLASGQRNRRFMSTWALCALEFHKADTAGAFGWIWCSAFSKSV